jgi:hypothetical protein
MKETGARIAKNIVALASLIGTLDIPPQHARDLIVKQFKRLFELDGVELQFTPEALRAAARDAMKLKTGARGLRTIIERVLLEVMYEVPSRPEIVRCVVNADCITQGTPPLLLMHGGLAVAWGEPRAEGSRPHAPSYDWIKTRFLRNRNVSSEKMASLTHSMTRPAHMVDVSEAETARGSRAGRDDAPGTLAALAEATCRGCAQSSAHRRIALSASG